MTATVLHRVGQFWRHTSARVTESDLARVQAILGPSLMPLFRELPVNDQRHGLDVLDTVMRQHASTNHLLAQAALLHDIGKSGAGVTVWERSLAVFLNAVSPRGLHTLLRLRPDFARRYATYRNHATIGAETLRAAGAPELAAVVAEHHRPQPESPVTRALQSADERN